MGQPPSAGGTHTSPVHGVEVDPLRPAWESWIPSGVFWLCAYRTTRAHASACSSDHSPAQWGLIRPAGVTPVDSATIRPAPPLASDPRCTRCQSPTTPSTAEYWHIGDTQARLRKVAPRTVSGVNRCEVLTDAARRPG